MLCFFFGKENKVNLLDIFWFFMTPFFYFYGIHYSCSILGWLLVKKRVIHAFNAYTLSNWFKSVKQMSALLNVNFWASQTMSQVIKTKRKRKIFFVEQILVPNKQSRLLLRLEVRSELWIEFLKKSVDPLTKLQLEKQERDKSWVLLLHQLCKRQLFSQTVDCKYLLFLQDFLFKLKPKQYKKCQYSWLLKKHLETPLLQITGSL